MLRLAAKFPAADYRRLLIPCQDACPVHTDVRGYVRAIAAGKFEEAYLIARGPNPFASICGRVCAAPCEKACRRSKIPRLDQQGRFLGYDVPVAIRALKRFVCEKAGPEARPIPEVLSDLKSFEPSVCADAEEMAALLKSAVKGAFKPGEGQPVAIIGGGPAGLSAAHDLALMDFKPTVFESEPVIGGMLALGIPSYRLPRGVIAREIDVIKALGVNMRTGVTVGKDVSLAELRKDFEAVIIAVGAKASRALGLPGERGPGVYGGVDFLRAVALGISPEIGREVVVIGAGNVAYDVARTALRHIVSEAGINAQKESIFAEVQSVLTQIEYDTARTALRLSEKGKVYLISRRSLEDMRADASEVLEGTEEGVQLLNGWAPLQILRDSRGRVRGAEFCKCVRIGDDHGGSDYLYDRSERVTIPCDTVLLAVGQTADLGFIERGAPDIELVQPGWLKVQRETLSTTARGVFAAGDVAHGPRLLIDAVASGKAVARSVYHYLTGRKITFEQTICYLPVPGYQRERYYEALRRVPVKLRAPDQRLQGQDIEVEMGYGREEALKEASRCLDCGVTPIFDSSRCVLCGGCADVCPTGCLKLVPLSQLDIQAPHIKTEDYSAILKDEDRCIRCACCARRCPTGAITMERVILETAWKCTADPNSSQTVRTPSKDLVSKGLLTIHGGGNYGP